MKNEAGEKLEVRNGRGLWLLIDNSKDENGNGMNELEAVQSHHDNKTVQDFFNGLKNIPAERGAPSYTPGLVLEMLHDVTANQQFIMQSHTAMAENEASHIALIKALGEGVNDLNQTIKRLPER